jgi:tetratricopeptide (TPR) repeat protein
MDRAHESAELARDGLALARQVGNRYWEWSFLGFAYPLFALGDWDEVVAREDGLPEEDWAQARIAFATLLTSIVPVRVNRGQLEEAKRSTRLFAEFEASADLQEQAQVHVAEATLLLAEGKHSEALRSAEASLETRHAMGISYEAVKESFVVAVEAALALDDVSRAEELLAVVDTLPPGGSPQFLQAHSSRFRARLATRRADSEEADRLFKRAGGLFRELAFPFYLAVTLLEQGEWLMAQDRGEEAQPLLGEARETFVRLKATPWLERAARGSDVGQQAEAVT